MRYFHLNLRDATTAQQMVWERQEMAGIKLTGFRTSAEGSNASVWTEDAAGETLFRDVLNELELSFEEGDTQQVVTWLDRYGL